jgi:predicted 3-demethylubiquinone-9 3-methyltransferase (glyoxalase superfamily)
MVKYDAYLVCKENIRDVAKFLKPFFKEKKGRYNHSGWRTFMIPNTNFTINLMKGKGLPMTKNISFEIGCKTKKELEKYSKKFKRKILNFKVTETKKDYIYNYIDLKGPKNICKMEIFYCEDI